MTDIETVPRSFDSMRRLFTEALGVGVPEWLLAAEAEWLPGLPEPTLDVAVAIWRDPWMVVGSEHLHR